MSIDEFLELEEKFFQSQHDLLEFVKHMEEFTKKQFEFNRHVAKYIDLQNDDKYFKGYA